MTSTKFFLTAAAMVLPFGMASAQLSSPESSTADTAVSSDQSVSTQPAGPEASAVTAETSAPVDSAATATASSAQPVAVAKADVKAGASVSGSDGSTIGKVESVSADAAIISTGKAKAQIPFTSLGKTDKGLVIAMSKSEFEAAASGKSAS